MSWTNELYQIYELNCTRTYKDNEPVMLPISHSTANAQIEVTIDEDGNFKNASQLPKELAVTTIPVTEDSGARSSGICPMPLSDKLVYIAGDYQKFAEGRRADNSDYFHAYMNQLQTWAESENSHPAVSAIYQYLEKSELMHDLVQSGVLKLNEDTGKLLEKEKIAGIPQEDAFARFVVNYHDLLHETRTWQDNTLYDSFIKFNSSQMGNQQLCYATGELLPATYKHPSKIRNGGDKAKLISSNDESGFTYRGRFSGKEETLSISYEFSQKMHNALKWLISTQGQYFGSLTLIIWASALQPIPKELNKKPIEEDDDWYDDDETEYPDTMPLYKKQLSRYLTDYAQKFDDDTKIMIMGLDSATTGRLSVSLYDELHGSEFLKSLENWHENSAWLRFDGKHNMIKSFSLYEIIKSAYGTEQNGELKCDEKFIRDQILRLLPCVMNKRNIPEDLIQSLYHKASNPLAYEKSYNHRLVLETACGMIRIFTIRNQKGAVTMGFDPNETNRSYLYGCLLAIADKAESDTYEDADKSKRITNAKRYWNHFAQAPYQTWGIIEEKIQPYLNQHPYKTKIQTDIQMIMDKMTPETFADNSRLEPLYLLGYHHFTAYLYPKKNKEDK